MKTLVSLFKNMKFRNKLLLSYMVVIIIPIFGLGIFSYMKSKSFVEEQIAYSLRENAQQISNNISSRLEKDNEFIRFTAFNFNLREVLSDKVFSLEDIRNINDYFEPISWYYLSINRDLNKLYIYSDYIERKCGSFLCPSEEVKEENWYKETCESKDTMWYFDNSTMYATRRIYDATKQQLLGVAYIEMNLNYIINEAVANSKKNYGLILMDKKKEQILNFGHISHTKEQLKKIVDKKSDGMVSVNGETFFTVREKLPLQNWEVIYYVPTVEFAHELNSILKMTIIIIMICFVILILIIWLFSNTLVKRIYKLNEAMEIVEKGDLSVEIQSESLDEIGQLTNRFNKMLYRINTLIDEVYKSKIIQKEAELKALQSQMNPHFLYNSLSLINWKAIDTNNNEISQIAKFLSKFYRTALNNGTTIISIEDEIINIKAYIEIQLIMHDYDFEVIYNIDEIVYTYETINFTLQPIIENAIIHGIDENEGVQGRLEIDIEKNEENIIFRVKDNGVGMTKEKAITLTSYNSKGYGVKNVDERLKLFFGDDYKIDIVSCINSGTTVTMTIPLYN